MTTREESIERDSWLAEASALRRLAASLLRDEHEAEDLVQETWLRARKSEATKSGPWFRTVIRNLARDRMRERGRRQRGEQDAARSERMPSEEEVGERLEVARRVAVEVARLDEPYRTTIHLRYFEDLSPEEIARISGVPVETVRTRLRRGLETLREHMDRAHGGKREAWALALAPLAARVRPTAGGILTAAGAIMSTKLAISGAAAVVVAVGLIFLWPHVRSAESHAPATAHARSPEELQGDPELRARIGGALAATREAISSPPPKQAAESASEEVHGTVVIEDEKGAEHANESGSLTIAHFTSEQDAVFQEIAVKDGTWTTSVPINRNLIIGKLVARDREAVLPEPRPLAPGPDPIAVRGKWLSRGWLRVVDAKTKQDLQGIEVRCADSWRGNPFWTHPGDDPRVKTVASGVASPVELPDRHWLTPYWVHAPDHVWARIDFDHRAGGGQRTVELSPTPSSVVVTITGGEVPEKACVRLYPRPERDPRSGLMILKVDGHNYQMPDRPESGLAAVGVKAPREGSVRIDDLQAGRFVAAVEVGEYEVTLRLGEAPVDVEAGGSASVTVPIDLSALNVDRTHLTGIIEVPEGFDRGRCNLRLRRIGGGEKPYFQQLSAMSFNSGDERHLQWDAGLVRTGDYDAMVQGIEHRLVIHAPGPGDTQVTIRIPPLVTVVVDVVDAQSGAKLEPERLQWVGPRLEGATDCEMVPLQRDPRTGFFHFVTTRGTVEIYGEMPGYEAVQKKLVLDGPEVTCTLSLNRASGLRILFREDGAALPVGFDSIDKIRIIRDDGTRGLAVPAGSSDSECKVTLPTPGRYRIEFPELEGFEPIEPKLVDVTVGEVVDVTVTPKRKR